MTDKRLYKFKYISTLTAKIKAILSSKLGFTFYKDETSRKKHKMN